MDFADERRRYTKAFERYVLELSRRMTIRGVGFLRLPFRGWYVLPTGEDMELNGAVPDVIVWPQPGEMPRGKDVQLEKAVEVLREDVEAWKARPQPTLRKASERPK